MIYCVHFEDFLSFESHLKSVNVKSLPVFVIGFTVAFFGCTNIYSMFTILSLPLVIRTDILWPLVFSEGTPSYNFSTPSSTNSVFETPLLMSCVRSLTFSLPRRGCSKFLGRGCTVLVYSSVTYLSRGCVVRVSLRRFLRVNRVHVQRYEEMLCPGLKGGTWDSPNLNSDLGNAFLTSYDKITQSHRHTQSVSFSFRPWTHSSFIRLEWEGRVLTGEERIPVVKGIPGDSLSEWVSVEMRSHNTLNSSGKRGNSWLKTPDRVIECGY